MSVGFRNSGQFLPHYFALILRAYKVAVGQLATSTTNPRLKNAGWWVVILCSLAIVPTAFHAHPSRSCSGGSMPSFIRHVGSVKNPNLIQRYLRKILPHKAGALWVPSFF